MRSPRLCLVEEAVSEKLFGIKATIYKLDSLCPLLLIGKEMQIQTTSPIHSGQNLSTTSLASAKYIQHAPHEVWAQTTFGVYNGWFQGPVVNLDPFDVKTSMQC